MEVSELYERLVDFGYVFRCENGKVAMKAALVPNNDPRHEEWREVVGLVTETKWDNDYAKQKKKDMRRSLSQYVKDMSVFSEKSAVMLLQYMSDKLSKKFKWTGEEFLYVKEHDPALYELYQWYENDIDLCFAEGDMIDFRSTVQMYGKCMENIWYKAHWAEIEADADRDNPFKNDNEVKNQVDSIRQEKKKKGKKDIPDIFKFNQSSFDYFSGLNASHRSDTDNRKWD